MFADYNHTGETHRKLKNNTLLFFYEKRLLDGKYPPKEREDGRSQDLLFSVINANTLTSPSTCKLLQSNRKTYVVLG